MTGPASLHRWRCATKGFISLDSLLIWELVALALVLIPWTPVLLYFNAAKIGGVRALEIYPLLELFRKEVIKIFTVFLLKNHIMAYSLRHRHTK
jgi:hypothetical protein